VFLSPIPASTVSVDGIFTDPGGYGANVEALLMQDCTVGAITYTPCLFNKATTTAADTVRTGLGTEIGQIRRRRLRLPN
jgi:hypothetical protein